jgi:RNA polymerase sigma factor (sigma-70 family)
MAAIAARARASLCRSVRPSGIGHWIAPDALASLVRSAQHAGGIRTRELDALLTAIRPALLAFCARRLDAASADDVAQRVLWTVSRDVQSVAADQAGRWLVTVARNALRDEYRRRAIAATRFVAADAARQVAGSERASAAVEYAELRRAVTRAARLRCGPAVRDVIAGILDGLTVRDIADLSGATPHAVRTRLLRARAVLGPILRPLLQ